MKALRVMIAIIAVLLLSGSQGLASATTGVDPIQIQINGTMLDSEVAPQIISDRTMVPLRVISEYLGCQVEWDEQTRTITVASPGTVSPSRHADRRAGNEGVNILVDGKALQISQPDPSPCIISGRTLVPLRAIGVALNKKVDWDEKNRMVTVDDPPVEIFQASPADVDDDADDTELPVMTAPASLIDQNLSIFGEATASAQTMKELLLSKNPEADPTLVDLYLSIGREYGIRGDVAFSQAAKETRWFTFTGLVQPDQNNYCGLAATGAAATGAEDLFGADPARVRYQEGVHGAIFDSPAAGVEAHIQHLYAYACKRTLPAGKDLLDPRFIKPDRGCASRWVDLSGKWAVPGYDKALFPDSDEKVAFQKASQAGKTYGHSILNDYYQLFFLSIDQW